MKQIWGIGFLLIAGLLIAQAQQRSVTVLSADSLQPVEDAFVIVRSLEDGKSRPKTTLTNAEGIATIPFQGPVSVKITHTSYLDAEQKIAAGSSPTIQIVPLTLQLADVVVTAQYNPDDPRNSVFPVDIIKAEELDERGANNLNDVMRQELNIRLSQDNILGSSMSIQGLSGEQIKIMVDGVPVIGRLNGNIDLSQVNLNDAEQIEVIQGPVSVEYGSNALGGVINIITRGKEREQFKTEVNGFYESAGTYNVDGSVSGSIKNHYLRASGGRYFFDGWSEEDTSRHKQWKPKEQYFANLAYGYNFKNDLRLMYTGSFFKEKITNRGEPRTPTTAFDDHYNTLRHGHNVTLKGPVLQNHFIENIFAYNFFQRRKNRFVKDLVTLEETPTAAVSDHDTTRFDAVLARGWISRNRKDKIFNYQLGYDINVEFGTGQRIEADENYIGDYAVFGSFRIKPLPQFTIQPGVRWSYNSKYKAPVTPSLHLKGKVGQWVTLRATYARGFRAPSLKELYFLFVDVNHNIQGNDELKAEKSHNVTFTTTYRQLFDNTHHISVEPSFFFNHIEDQITLALVDAEEQLYSYVNVGQFQTTGASLRTQYRFGKRLSVSVGASYIGRRNRLENVDASTKFYFSPEVSAEVSYRIPKAEVTVSVFNKYNGEVQSVFIDGNGNLNNQYLQAYNTLDVSLNRSFWENRINLTFGAKNLLNVTNINATATGVHSSGNSAPIAWGRTFFASLNFTFSK